MTRPRIAIPLPTSSDEAYNQRSWPMYAAAVEQADGVPVAVELSPGAGAVRDLVRGCAGVLLPGSPADVAPDRYGAEPDPATNKADAAREAVDWTLLEESERCHLPVLAICYGIQSLNVYRGGSLLQDLLPLPVNHSAGRTVAVAHAAEVARDSLLASLLPANEAPEIRGFRRLPVNSSHHQSIATPGQHLRIVARCPDDAVIEAVEGPYNPGDPWFLLGVQWHPERSVDISPSSRALFSRLIAEAQRHSPTHAQPASRTPMEP
ncbi:MAG TPA: gamma-glutamyl-gamma-aminobutyrate hydrolase family protein [Acidobacteriaceae bacterium]|nr:gamma-glutamyl-gamma-aminobutyrate hydrolase family protein [Acidobacteriaceae bacterium]